MASFDLWPTATNIAKKQGIDPALFRALIRAESGGDQNAGSPAGAIGFTQLMPGTAAGLGVDPYNPRQNLVGGARYLKQQLDAHGGDIRLALAAYNAGPGAVAKYGGVPPFAETQAYVKKVVEFMKEFPGGGGGGAGESGAGTNPISRRSPQTGDANVDALFQGPDPTDELLRLLVQPGRISASEIQGVDKLKRQQLQDQRTSADLKVAERRERVGKKGKPPKTTQTAGPSKKKWGALKGVGNTNVQFMLKAIKKAQDLGLAARENPYVDPVDPVHTEGSYHDRNFDGRFDGKRVGRGLDVVGEASAMDQFFRWAIKFRPTELFYDPLGQYDSGRYSSQGIGGHGDHVHLSV